MHEHRALEKARRWLLALDIPADDIERNILLIFCLALANEPAKSLRACGRRLGLFNWYQYHGDPVPAMASHRVLMSVGFVHPSLLALHDGYRSVLDEDGGNMGLILDLLSVPSAHQTSLDPPPLATLATAARDEVMDLCRRITMAGSAGARRIDWADASPILPALAFSYARDWDLEACCALLRACAYLRLARSTACRWTVEWLLHQQQADGRFGLLHVEGARGGWDSDDWRPYFDRTVSAVWALADVTDTSPLPRLLRSQLARQGSTGFSL